MKAKPDKHGWYSIKDRKPNGRDLDYFGRVWLYNPSRCSKVEQHNVMFIPSNVTHWAKIIDGDMPGVAIPPPENIKHPAAVALGSLGGRANTEAQQAARRANGKKRLGKKKLTTI